MVLLSTNPNPSKSHFATPYDSQQGIPDNVSTFLVIVFLLFFVYVVLRVRKSLKK